MKGPRTKIGYFSQNHREELNEDLNLLQTVLKYFPHLADVDARSILGHFAFPGDSVFKSVRSLSGGEQSRLRLALLVHTQTNCLLLDEPTNHLDIVVRDALKRALVAYPGSVVVISHDPEFLTGFCDRTFQVSGGKIKNLNVSFDDYLLYHKEDEVEISQSGGRTVESNKAPSMTKSAKNQLKNRVKTLDREIPDLEKRLELLEKNKKSKEELLADPEFYKNRSYQTELDSYNEIKNEIANLTQRWEDAHKELDILKEQVNS